MMHAVIQIAARNPEERVIVWCLVLGKHVPTLKGAYDNVGGVSEKIGGPNAWMQVVKEVKRGSCV